jgi:hypothetical protein
VAVLALEATVDDRTQALRHEFVFPLQALCHARKLATKFALAASLFGIRALGTVTWVKRAERPPVLVVH